MDTSLLTVDLEGVSHIESLMTYIKRSRDYVCIYSDKWRVVRLILVLSPWEGYWQFIAADLENS